MLPSDLARLIVYKNVSLFIYLRKYILHIFLKIAYIFLITKRNFMILFKKNLPLNISADTFFDALQHEPSPILVDPKHWEE